MTVSSIVPCAAFLADPAVQPLPTAALQTSRISAPIPSFDLPLFPCSFANVPAPHSSYSFAPWFLSWFLAPSTCFSIHVFSVLGSWFSRLPLLRCSVVPGFSRWSSVLCSLFLILRSPFCHS